MIKYTKRYYVISKVFELMVGLQLLYILLDLQVHWLVSLAIAFVVMTVFKKAMDEVVYG